MAERLLVLAANLLCNAPWVNVQNANTSFLCRNIEKSTLSLGFVLISAKVLLGLDFP
jgi:hypothetical protein